MIENRRPLMMEHWQKIKLGDISEVIGGGTPSTKNYDFWNGDIPWLTPKDLSGYNFRYISKGERNITKLGLQNSSARMLPKETVLLTSRAPIGYVAIAENEVCTNQGFKSIVLKEGYCSEFFYYLLKNNIDYIVGMASGSTFAEISGTQVKNLEFTIPPLEVQRKIAGVLGALDDKIELNNKINQNLELQAQALILDYIQHTEEKIPLGDLTTFTNGFAFKSSDYLPSGTYKIITIKNVQDGSVDSQGAACLDELPEKLSKDCCLCIGDVLLSLTGNVGRVGIVTEENLLLNQRVAKINSKDSNLLPFVYFYMRLPAMKTEMENISKGTAQQNLSPVETLKLEISFDREKATELSQTLKTFYDELIFNTIQNQNLTALRDTLLPKLMSGEINVDNVDISEQKERK